jgi:hypothetical protein
MSAKSSIVSLPIHSVSILLIGSFANALLCMRPPKTPVAPIKRDASKTPPRAKITAAVSDYPNRLCLVAPERESARAATGKVITEDGASEDLLLRDRGPA